MTTNHPAHGPVSLERLHQIREILSKASAQSDGGNLGYAMADAVKVIDGAIAAFAADPVPFDSLRDAVAEVSGGPAMEWSDIYKGHQAVPFINFNSLARIVDKFRVAQPAPVVPDGCALVPRRLTAGNGAKGVLSGEFSETKFINCPECFGDDECETCDGSGRIEITVPVSWTNIKAIWAKGIEHFTSVPQKENI
ncbi:TPA: hypothetical protein NVL72_001285 [Citrobacter freundii]|nr:hypothetical protein [Citrobacter freundii]